MHASSFLSRHFEVSTPVSISHKWWPKMWPLLATIDWFIEPDHWHEKRTTAKTTVFYVASPQKYSHCCQHKFTCPVCLVLSASSHSLKEAPLIVMHTDKPQQLHYLRNTTAARLPERKRKGRFSEHVSSAQRRWELKSHRKWLQW